MDEKLAKEVKECLCGERTIYHYFPDKYAIDILKKVLANQTRLEIAALRKSHWAKLLHRPVVRELIANSGDGYLDLGKLNMVWPETAEPYVLTLGEWGRKKDWSWNQTSRPGRNLVLQLNLSEFWAKLFRQALKERPNTIFSRGHPVSAQRSITLAWARLDIDFETNEVLIEELQSDLVRYVAHLRNLALDAYSRGSTHFRYWPYDIEVDSFLVFANPFVAKFKKHWQEAVLAATINFITEELGVSNIFYHHFDTGNKLKNLKYATPPRSLYTDLPLKFCFSRVNDAPRFLMEEKRVRKKLKKLKESRWFYMAA